MNTGTADFSDLDIGGSDFVANGDILTLGYFSHDDRASISSTSYTSAFAGTNMTMDPATAFPSGATLVAAISAFISLGTDETARMRLQETEDSVTLVESSDITSGGAFMSSFSTWDPSNITGAGRFQLQYRSQPGENTTTFDQTTMILGIQL